MNPVQFITMGGKWKNLIVLGQTVIDMGTAINIVRAAKISNIRLQQVRRIGVLEWDNF